MKKINFENATLIDPTLKIISDKKIRIINDYYPYSIINQERFDLIYSINVLEHVYNQKIYSLMLEIILKTMVILFSVFLM